MVQGEDFLKGKEIYWYGNEGKVCFFFVIVVDKFFFGGSVLMK